MAVQGDNWRSLTPQQKLVKVVVRLGDEALAKGESKTEVAQTVDRFTNVAEAMSTSDAEAILAKLKE